MNALKKLIYTNSRSPWKNNFYEYKRPLYSSSVLGLDTFIERREKTRNSFKKPDLCKSRLRQTCDPKSKGLIFSYDILNMTHLVENDEDLDTLNKLLKKMCLQTKIRVVKNLFGPEVMRLYHLMNKPNEAIALVKDPLLYSEFENVTSFMVFLDLLFKNELYEEVIKMYEYHMAKSAFSIKSIFLNTFYFAACYKLNNEYSLKKALDLWRTLLYDYQKPGIKIRLLFAALLLKQNQIISAMDVLHSRKFNSVAENLKCLGLFKSNRYYDAFERISTNMTLNEENFFMLKEVIDDIEKEVSSSEHSSEFSAIKQELINKNLIIDQPLDEFLCTDLKPNVKEIFKPQEESIKYM